LRSYLGMSLRWPLVLALAWALLASAACLTTFANLSTPSWHALYFGVGYLAVGIGMALALAGAGWSARNSAGPGSPREITTGRRP
jgi:hypothetical protein